MNFEIYTLTILRLSGEESFCIRTCSVRKRETEEEVFVFSPHEKPLSLVRPRSPTLGSVDSSWTLRGTREWTVVRPGGGSDGQRSDRNRVF